MANLPVALQFAPEPQKILVVLPTWVGDVVMATPFLASLHKRFATAELTFVMHRHLHSVLAGSPWLGRVATWPARGKSAEHKSARAAFIRALRAENFDLAVLLPNSFSSAWLAFRSGAKRRVGFNRDGRGLLLTDRIRVPNKRPNKTEAPNPGSFEPMPLVQYYAFLAAALGCEPPGDQLQLVTQEADNAHVNELLLAAGIEPDQPLITLCPGANFGASKCWAPERFAQVADLLVKTFNAGIVISPGPGEEPLARAIASAMHQPHVLLDQPCITLGELKSLISRSALLLGNDTGPRHFARAFDVHRVTVFGPTEPRWTDTSHGKETIVRVQVPCGPCHLKVCPLERQICMEDVTVEMVFAACQQELAAYRK
ncbi:MAG: lipopolysaccharide heptosyltransferase II [bacterium]